MGKDIANMNVLITGAARRIGAAIAKNLANQGANIIVHCNNSLEEAEKLLNELPNGKLKHQIITGDLYDYESLIAKLNKLNCGIDILINNAAIFNIKSILQESADDVLKQMTINFTAPYELMKWFARQKKVNEGIIINFLDQRNIKADGTTGSYAISKKALEQASLAAAVQFAPNIRVNNIAPGPVLSPPNYQGKGFEKVLENVPLQKQVSVDSIINAVDFLIGNCSVTGQILYVDGGEHLI
ncbi:SDR family oxidoreductase [Lentisphaerota bacterium WC36G]|nr:SDR family oxidoreductase [Lentisphaerae bacterium WC36]